MSVVALTPCLSCGACCAHFRISFYWSEGAPELGGTVPPELIAPLNHSRVVMKGTDSKTPRCICLSGAVGEQVACAIYPQRPSTCREFDYSWQYGERNERCDQARAAHGLPPLPAPNPVEPDRPVTPRAA